MWSVNRLQPAQYKF